jgi:RNA polymerase sigma-70 factor (ECF subfamily)
MRLRRPDRHGRHAFAAADAAADADADADARRLADFAAGDVAAFEALYARHEQPVYRFLLRSVRDARLAEELLQDVWMRVIAHADRFEPRARFTTWLYRIARNRLIDHWRSSDADALVALDDSPREDDSAVPADAIPASTSSQPEVQVQDRQQARAYASAVESLPAVQRETFLLHCHAELSLEQISAITGAGIETIKSRLRYARAKLRDALTAWDPAP